MSVERELMRQGKLHPDDRGQKQAKWLIMDNPWGWSVRGTLRWLRWWAWWPQVWGIEITSYVGLGPRGGRMYRRRGKVGPVCFPLGTYEKEPYR